MWQCLCYLHCQLQSRLQSQLFMLTTSFNCSSTYMIDIGTYNNNTEIFIVRTWQISERTIMILEHKVHKTFLGLPMIYTISMQSLNSSQVQVQSIICSWFGLVWSGLVCTLFHVLLYLYFTSCLTMCLQRSMYHSARVIQSSHFPGSKL